MPEISVTQHLTSREIDVLRFTVRKYTVKYVAKKLYISKRTVDTHMGRIYQKLSVQSRDELIEKYDRGEIHAMQELHSV